MHVRQRAAHKHTLPNTQTIKQVILHSPSMQFHFPLAMPLEQVIMGVKSGSQQPLDALVSSLLRLYSKQRVYINSSGMLSPAFPFSPLFSFYSPNTSVFLLPSPLFMACSFFSALHSTFLPTLSHSNLPLLSYSLNLTPSLSSN